MTGTEGQAKPAAQPIAADLALFHRLAGGGGRIILASFGEDSATGEALRPRIESFAQGAVDRMSARAVALASEPHRNVHAGLATMWPDLAPARKGGAADIVGVFGLWVDFDAQSDAQKHAGRDNRIDPQVAVR